MEFEMNRETVSKRTFLMCIGFLKSIVFRGNQQRQHSAIRTYPMRSFLEIYIVHNSHVSHINVMKVI